VLAYRSRYTHRVSISNRRLSGLGGATKTDAARVTMSCRGVEATEKRRVAGLSVL
jgi:hypothetical protein